MPLIRNVRRNSSRSVRKILLTLITHGRQFVRGEWRDGKTKQALEFSWRGGQPYGEEGVSESK